MFKCSSRTLSVLFLGHVSKRLAFLGHPTSASRVEDATFSVGVGGGGVGWGRQELG